MNRKRAAADEVPRARRAMTPSPRSWPTPCARRGRPGTSRRSTPSRPSSPAGARRSRLEAELGGLDEAERRALGEALNEVRRPGRRGVAAASRRPRGASRGEILEADRLDLTEVLAARRDRGISTSSRGSARSSRTSSSAWATRSPRDPRSRPTGTTSRRSTCRPTTRLAAGRTASTSTSATARACCCARTPRPCRSTCSSGASCPSTPSCPASSTAATRPDASHLPVFHQIEGLVVDCRRHLRRSRRDDRHLHEGDLRGRRRGRGCARGTSRSPSRRRSSTSPARSAAGRAAGPAPGSAGSSSAAAGWSTRRCSSRPASIPRGWSGFAFGFGIDRVAIMRHGIEDLRSLVDNDVRFLTGF